MISGMQRSTLIQAIIKKKKYRNYLEIGCQYGMSFLPTVCKNKIAVDPSFNIPLKRKLKWLLKNRTNIHNRYFEETSDDFFAKRKNELKKRGQLDIVLVDGLHTFEAALKDVLNSLHYLQQDGIIIMHDSFPPHKAAATPGKDYDDSASLCKEGWTGEWCGDVWKSIVYLKRAFPNQMDVYVINTDYGLGIVKPKGQLTSSLALDKKIFDEVNKLTYDEMMVNPQEMIGLRDGEYAERLIREI
jgi:hypothetical protein